MVFNHHGSGTVGLNFAICWIRAELEFSSKLIVAIIHGLELILVVLVKGEETRIKISFQYKLPGILLGSGQLLCHALFFCCPQKSPCLFPFSLLSPVVSNQSPPFLIFANRLYFYTSSLHLCRWSKHAAVFTTCKEKEVLQKQRDLSSVCATRIFFPPS